MLIKNVEIYVALMPGEDYEDSMGNFKNAIDELVGLSGEIDIIFQKKVISKLKIKKLTQRHKEIKEIFKGKYIKSVITKFLKFSSQIKILNKEQLEEREERYFSFEYFVEKFVQHLIIYSNLAKPGAFDTREGIVKIQDIAKEKTIQFDEFPILANSITFSNELAKKYKWPPIKELSIKKTLDWLYQHWESLESISESRIQRALNAFSYVFHDSLSSDDDHSSGDLFHALVGIEAIYVVGNNNIQEQVNQKTQLLLGKRNDFKKVFNELYDYRSRYVHGQLNIINRFFIDEKDIAIDQLLKTYEHSAFAIAILISSIQKHIELDKNEFEFELIMKE